MSFNCKLFPVLHCCSTRIKPNTRETRKRKNSIRLNFKYVRGTITATRWTEKKINKNRKLHWNFRLNRIVYEKKRKESENNRDENEVFVVAVYIGTGAVSRRCQEEEVWRWFWICRRGKLKYHINIHPIHIYSIHYAVCTSHREIDSGDWCCIYTTKMVLYVWHTTTMALLNPLYVIRSFVRSLGWREDE